jgi:type II secretory pathway component PulC
MMTWLQRNPLAAALSVLAIALATVIAFEAEYGSSLASVLAPGASRRAVPADAKLLPPLLATAPEQAYPETAARPLFIPTRRPAPEALAAPQSTFQKGQFVLQGVIAVGENRIAMLREKSNGRIHRVERGRELNGIKVLEIEREAVTLAQGGEQETLSMNVQKGPGAPQAAAGQGPFAATAAPANAAPAAPAQVNPAAAPARAANAPIATPQNTPHPSFAQNPNPAARAVPEAAAAPMSPEELLARRRARRTQQNQ